MPAVLASSLTLAACGDDAAMPGHDMQSTTSTATSPSDSATTPEAESAGPHNDADAAFATGMIPHHGQAITMADLALDAATTTQVKDLAAQIKAAQDPEIQTMSGWLKSWGLPVSPAQGMDHAGMDHEGGGMMPTQQMDELEQATGADFDRMWLQMMIAHHQGAVTMARLELSTGSNAQVKQLAQAVIDGQTKEIATMKALLAGG
jgi:uncharacterized protein (DUF305 family)